MHASPPALRLSPFVPHYMDMTTTATLTLPPTTHVPRPYEGPTRAEVLADRRRYTNPAVFTLYADPLMIVEGRGQYVWDETGRRYLDFFAGIVTLSCGHSHPTIVAAGAGAAGSAPAHHDDLPASQLPETRQGPGCANAGGSGRHLFREQRQRSERPRRDDGARLHRQHRCAGIAERLPWRDARGDGPHVTSHLEVQRRVRRARSSRDEPRPVPESVRGHARGDRDPERATTSAR